MDNQCKMDKRLKTIKDSSKCFLCGNRFKIKIASDCFCYGVVVAWSSVNNIPAHAAYCRPLKTVCASLADDALSQMILLINCALRV